MDVGGGSTELSWVDLRPDKAGRPKPIPPVGAWVSVPIGVVTLAERFPETPADTAAWFRAMVDHFRAEVERFAHAEPFRAAFAGGQAHLVGTSGAITSLAGMHLGLQRYERSRVDGLWLTRDDCTAAAQQLIALGGRGSRGAALHRSGPRRPGARRRGDPPGGAGGLALRARAGSGPRSA